MDTAASSSTPTSTAAADEAASTVGRAIDTIVPPWHLARTATAEAGSSSTATDPTQTRTKRQRPPSPSTEQHSPKRRLLIPSRHILALMPSSPVSDPAPSDDSPHRFSDLIRRSREPGAPRPTLDAAARAQQARTQLASDSIAAETQASDNGTRSRSNTTRSSVSAASSALTELTLDTDPGDDRPLSQDRPAVSPLVIKKEVEDAAAAAAAGTARAPSPRKRQRVSPAELRGVVAAAANGPPASSATTGPSSTSSSAPSRSVPSSSAAPAITAAASTVRSAVLGLRAAPVPASAPRPKLTSSLALAAAAADGAGSGAPTGFRKRSPRDRAATKARAAASTSAKARAKPPSAATSTATAAPSTSTALATSTAPAASVTTSTDAILIAAAAFAAAAMAAFAAVTSTALGAGTAAASSGAEGALRIEPARAEGSSLRAAAASAAAGEGRRARLAVAGPSTSLPGIASPAPSPALTAPAGPSSSSTPSTLRASPSKGKGRASSSAASTSRPRPSSSARPAAPAPPAVKTEEDAAMGMVNLAGSQQGKALHNENSRWYGPRPLGRAPVPDGLRAEEGLAAARAVPVLGAESRSASISAAPSASAAPPIPAAAPPLAQAPTPLRPTILNVAAKSRLPPPRASDLSASAASSAPAPIAEPQRTAPALSTDADSNPPPAAAAATGSNPSPLTIRIPLRRKEREAKSSSSSMSSLTSLESLAGLPPLPPAPASAPPAASRVTIPAAPLAVQLRRVQNQAAQAQARAPSPEVPARSDDGFVNPFWDLLDDGPSGPLTEANDDDVPLASALQVKKENPGPSLQASFGPSTPNGARMGASSETPIVLDDSSDDNDDVRPLPPPVTPLTAPRRAKAEPVVAAVPAVPLSAPSAASRGPGRPRARPQTRVNFALEPELPPRSARRVKAESASGQRVSLLSPEEEDEEENEELSAQLPRRRSFRRTRSEPRPFARPALREQDDDSSDGAEGSGSFAGARPPLRSASSSPTKRVVRAQADGDFIYSPSPRRGGGRRTRGRPRGSTKKAVASRREAAGHGGTGAGKRRADLVRAASFVPASASLGAYLSPGSSEEEEEEDLVRRGVWTSASGVVGPIKTNFPVRQMFEQVDGSYRQPLKDDGLSTIPLSQVFQPGDIIYGKIKGWRPWPAVVVQNNEIPFCVRDAMMIDPINEIVFCFVPEGNYWKGTAESVRPLTREGLLADLRELSLFLGTTAGRHNRRRARRKPTQDELLLDGLKIALSPPALELWRRKMRKVTRASNRQYGQPRKWWTRREMLIEQHTREFGAASIFEPKDRWARVGPGSDAARLITHVPTYLDDDDAWIDDPNDPRLRFDEALFFAREDSLQSVQDVTVELPRRSRSFLETFRRVRARPDGTVPQPTAYRLASSGLDDQGLRGDGESDRQTALNTAANARMTDAGRARPSALSDLSAAAAAFSRPLPASMASQRDEPGGLSERARGKQRARPTATSTIAHGSTLIIPERPVANGIVGAASSGARRPPLLSSGRSRGVNGRFVARTSASASANATPGPAATAPSADRRNPRASLAARAMGKKRYVSPSSSSSGSVDDRPSSSFGSGGASSAQGARASAQGSASAPAATTARWYSILDDEDGAGMEMEEVQEPARTGGRDSTARAGPPDQQDAGPVGDGSVNVKTEGGDDIAMGPAEPDTAGDTVGGTTTYDDDVDDEDNNFEEDEYEEDDEDLYGLQRNRMAGLGPGGFTPMVCASGARTPRYIAGGDSDDDGAYRGVGGSLANGGNPGGYGFGASWGYSYSSYSGGGGEMPVLDAEEGDGNSPPPFFGAGYMIGGMTPNPAGYGASASGGPTPAHYGSGARTPAYYGSGARTPAHYGSGRARTPAPVLPAATVTVLASASSEAESADEWSRPRPMVGAAASAYALGSGATSSSTAQRPAAVVAAATRDAPACSSATVTAFTSTSSADPRTKTTAGAAPGATSSGLGSAGGSGGCGALVASVVQRTAAAASAAWTADMDNAP